MTQECDAKFEEKLTNLADFHHSTRNCQNWDFHWILLYKIQNV